MIPWPPVVLQESILFLECFPFLDLIGPGASILQIHCFSYTRGLAGPLGGAIGLFPGCPPVVPGEAVRGLCDDCASRNIPSDVGMLLSVTGPALEPNHFFYVK